ncbi:NAD(P)H-dependent oxidoreductase [Kribbella sp. NBC_01245]|uniref:NADPH-dependent FMN reductase n=1 Tax=Kribbella sp. NBC_01245 TaxID=2903578 RepID=UPI002E2CCFFD|nr:NAD(P)H-dependent oxidoreductase [Kribbella sp. NBC_01245]
MPSVAFEPRIVPDPPIWPQSVVTVVGNPKPASRTATAATSVAELLASELGAPFKVDALVDLVTFAPALFQQVGESEDQIALADAIDLATSASVLVLATPVYKGSYTGLLKSFLDVLPPHALAGSVVVPVTISASPAHRLLADLHLRPVLAELGASVPTPPVALEERDLEDLQLAVSAWVRHNAGLVQAATIALQPVAEPTPAR